MMIITKLIINVLNICIFISTGSREKSLNVNDLSTKSILTLKSTKKQSFTVYLSYLGVNY